LLVSSVASANAADSFPQNTPSAHFGTPSGPTGRWYSANHAIVVQIAPCGSNLCGQIVGINLAHPGDPMPNNWLGHPQCGMTIIQTTQTPTPASPPHWTGTVTDPRNGNTYHATIALDPSRHLLLHGYLGLPIFGLTQTWDPYPGRTLAHCQLAANVPPAQG
jgi:uncharacterized protein (DUF2147 family)